MYRCCICRKVTSRGVKTPPGDICPDCCFTAKIDGMAVVIKDDTGKYKLNSELVKKYNIREFERVMLFSGGGF